MDITQSTNLESPTGNPFYNVDYVKLDPFWAQVQDYIKNFDIHSFDSNAKIILVILSIFFLTVIAYCAVRLLEIRKREHEHLHHEIEEYARAQHKEAEKKEGAKDVSTNPRWRHVITYTFSENPGDWKLAVLEADSMLEDLVDQLGFKGENLGEKLKNANQDKFKNLPIAWEVHTIRNRIAHEGVNFQFSGREAKRVVALYEQIFRDYGFI